MPVIAKFPININMILTTLCCVFCMCSTYLTLEWVCKTCKSDISSRTECDLNHISHICEFWLHLKLQLSMNIVWQTSQFVEQKFMLSYSFRCNKIQNIKFYEFGHTYVRLRGSKKHLRRVCWTSSLDLSRTTKCDQIDSIDFYGLSHT